MTESAPADADPLLGTTLTGTYVLDQVLGEGAMGRVYAARHTRIATKRFAIKVLHQQFAEHEEALARFQQEAEATALISSPHVVGVHDYGRTPDGRLYIVSDFLVGEELADRLAREGTLPVGEAVRIVRQICAGLAVAHANGVTHRDVKPENVFLVGADEDLTAKLLDFGISRFRKASGPALTRAGIALGTPDFMSPEQARGKPVDHRADIYGVGVLLYVTLTGVMPFERDTPQDTLLALLQEDAPSPRFIDPTIPEALEMVIQRAMAKEADDRYPWIAQLSQALAPYDAAHGAGTPAPPAPAATSLAPAPTGDDGETASSGRRFIWASFGLGAPAAFAALLLAVVGVLQAASVEVGLTAWLVTAVLLLLALGPPAALAVRHVWQAVLPNGLRTTRLARVLRPPVVAASAGYAVTSVAAGLLRAAAPSLGAFPLGDTLAVLVALVAGGIGFGVTRRRG